MFEQKNRPAEDVVNRRILFVEDDASLLTQMKNWFEAKGNAVRAASSLLDARTALENFTPEMIVLDVILPDGSGLELLQDLPSLPPVIVLSDLGDENNIIDGFLAGVTDYIVKPCSMRLLEARMRLRFLPRDESVAEYRGLRIECDSRKVFYMGKPVPLTSSEFNILWFLMKHPGKFFSADEIYENVWTAPSLQTTTIRRHLSTLRQKLKELSSENIIFTEFGKGYAFLPQGDTV